MIEKNLSLVIISIETLQTKQQKSGKKYLLINFCRTESNSGNLKIYLTFRYFSRGRWRRLLKSVFIVVEDLYQYVPIYLYNFI